jgi:hypothetical protein
MGEQVVRKTGNKTAPSKTLKEKRTAKADKKASNERSNNTDAVSNAKKR